MPEYLSEAIVLILDASRSMFRSDYSPNRLEACKEGVLTFIKSRINKDNEVGSKSAFSFVSINGAPKKNFSFFDDAKYEEFREALSSINCSGKSKIGDTIGMGIKILIEDIRTNGQRIPHIILFSDGMNTKSRIDPLKMANLAKQLGIKIDCVRIGDVEQFNILKQIATSTNGEFFYLNNISEIQRISNRLGGSNLQLIDPNEQSGKESISRKVLKKIASPLLSESEMNKGSKDQKNLIERLRGTKSYEKCSICFQPDDPISKSSFSISGGYCPNCAQPMHLSCASMWAKNQDKEGDGTVFRCVHCLYLLKIPASIQTKV